MRIAWFTALAVFMGSCGFAQAQGVVPSFEPGGGPDGGVHVTVPGCLAPSTNTDGSANKYVPCGTRNTTVPGGGGSGGISGPVAVTATPSQVATSATPNAFSTPTQLAANPSRKGCLIQYNGAGTLYAFVGSGAATTGASVQLPKGMPFSCGDGGLTVETGPIQLASSIASDTVVVLTW